MDKRNRKRAIKKGKILDPAVEVKSPSSKKESQPLNSKPKRRSNKV